MNSILETKYKLKFKITNPKISKPHWDKDGIGGGDGAIFRENRKSREEAWVMF